MTLCMGRGETLISGSHRARNVGCCTSWVAFEAKTERRVAVLTNAQGANEGASVLGKEILQAPR